MESSKCWNCVAQKRTLRLSDLDVARCQADRIAIGNLVAQSTVALALPSCLGDDYQLIYSTNVALSHKLIVCVCVCVCACVVIVSHCSFSNHNNNTFKDILTENTTFNTNIIN